MSTTVETITQTEMAEAAHSDAEIQAWQAFKEELTSRGLLERPADLPAEDLGYGINDDATLLRFLVARKYSVDDAVTHFEKAHRFRLDHRLGEAYEEMDVEAFEETQTLYPLWTGRVCKEGQPIFTLDLSDLSVEKLTAFSKSSAQLKLPESAADAESKPTPEMLRAVLFFDRLLRFVMPLCSAAAGNSGDMPASARMVILADLSGLSMRQMWNLKGYILNFSQLLSTNCPEILDKVYLINAPSSFPFLLNLLKRWVDPVTVAKLIVLTPDEVEKTLHGRIALEDLPKKYGGDLQYGHGIPPVLDGKVRELLSWTVQSGGSLPGGPIKLVPDAGERSKVVAVGSVDGKKRTEQIATVQKLQV